MPIATCPKCRFEFLAADAIDHPQVCPACSERFLFTPAMSEVAQAAEARSGGKPTSPAMMKFAGWTTAALGLLVDALLVTGNVSALREASSAGRLPPASVAASAALLLAVLAHAVLTLLAVRVLVKQPRRALLLGRLAVVCWLVLGGAAVLMGAHLWPASLNGQWDSMLLIAAGALVALGVVLTYLGGMEWLSQRIEKRCL